ncbi:paramyosin-like isoform X1 [Amazona aestiva]|uniref:Paramyosin-like isoform X1 n=1 Tax=Amazona aestiva TaxID=12930 RepID=A0A0Q3P8R0_AMAAE|nr:paramyosin-like isoform X1 [Amazona aestiva]
MVWRSEAVGKLRGCRERAANESLELGNAVAKLERERARLQRVQDALRRELAQAHGDSEKLNGSLVSCQERAARLVANATALGDELLALQRERDELARGKEALEGELAQGKEQALGLRQQLEQAMEQQRALRARGERCEARHRDLEATL